MSAQRRHYPLSQTSESCVAQVRSVLSRGVEVRERVQEFGPELPFGPLGPPASGRHKLRGAHSAASAGGTPAVPGRKAELVFLNHLG
jgi:hypothetical protein